MFFFVDESGHTGSNLFDPNQPVLYYGVTSSRLNVDLLGEDLLRPLRRRLSVARLHAAELGNGGLSLVASDLVRIQERLDLRFDLYRVRKPDYAIVSFFDQVFDQGMNPAVHWHSYWTPMRYVFLLKLAYVFDEPLAQRAWAARLNPKDAEAEADLTKICDELRTRLGRLPDARSREVLGNALHWAAQNPSDIRYNAKTAEEALAIAPNSIGFQSAMIGIAHRILRARSRRIEITVDRQSQFNKAQKTLAEFYARAKGVPLINGPGLPKLDFRGMPDVPLQFVSGHESAGLEITDLHLWVFKRYMEGKDVAPGLLELIRRQLHRSRTDEISLDSLSKRWSQWFEQLPEPSEEEMANGKLFQSKAEESRRAAMQRVADEKSGLLTAVQPIDAEPDDPEDAPNSVI